MKRTWTIKKKLLVSMMIISISQTIFFLGTVVFSGTIKTFLKNQYNNVVSTSNIKNEVIEGTLVDYKSCLDNYYEIINNNIIKKAKDNKIDLSKKIVSKDASILLQHEVNNICNLINQNKLGGLFVLFDNENSTNKSGLYLRMLDNGLKTKSSEGLMGEFGDPVLIKNNNIALDSLWTINYDIEESENQNFYNSVKNAYELNDNVKSSDLGYWSSTFKFRQQDIDVNTYTLPLVNEDNIVYGVIGIEIPLDVIEKYATYDDLGAGNSAGFIIAKKEDDIKYKVNSIYSPYLKTMFNENDEIYFNNKEAKEEGTGINGNNEKFIYTINKLNLYSTNVPYKELCLITLLNKEALNKNITSLEVASGIALLFSLILACIFIWTISSIISDTLGKLTVSLKSQNPAKKIVLPSVGIEEIDTLSASIESLSESISYYSGRLDGIFKISGVHIGAIDYCKKDDTVYCSSNIRSVINIPIEIDLNNINDIKNYFEIFVGKIQNNYIDNEEYIVFVDSKWLKMKTMHYYDHIIVIISDVTNEIIEKEKIEYERDYDSLTGLLNRNSFMIKSREIIDSYNGCIGCMLLDLDNLKYVNDVYGHEAGDLYIKGAADFLKTLPEEHFIAARRSGDEFMILVIGYKDERESFMQIVKMHNLLQKKIIKVIEEQDMKLRSSAGVAWYKKDAFDFTELVSKADFAMYDAKRTRKGTVLCFDDSVYQKDKLLINGVELLNVFLETTAVKYAFQPIVDIKTGKVFAFEGLMRPQMDELKSPEEIMRLAKSQSKLYYIEQMTWFKLLEDFSHQNNENNAKLFINSIPNTFLSNMDIIQIENNYGNILNNIVIEMLETEQINEKTFIHKKKFIKKWNAQIAIDDYGTGYSNEQNLIDITPQYVKIDMSLIRNIDISEERQIIVSNMVNYCSKKNIKIIAEGVETKEEYVYLRKIGIDYVQGYFVSKPDFNLKFYFSQVEEICN